MALSASALQLLLLLGALLPAAGKLHALPDPAVGAAAVTGHPPPTTFQARKATPRRCQYRQRQGGTIENQYFAICAIAHNQHEDLVEWIEHHLSLGVSVIYLYDHASDPPLKHMLTDYILAGIVEVFDVTSPYVVRRTKWVLNPKQPRKRANVQLFTQALCMQRFRHRHQFIGFIDVDEFFILKDPAVKDLPTFLKPYETFGGLAVHSVFFGTSGHLTRPAKATLAAYTKCYTSPIIKTIANTCFATVPMGVHSFAYRDGAVAVTENFDRVDHSHWPRNHHDGPLSTLKIALYHYATKSLAQFEEKRRRGAGDGNTRDMRFANVTDAAAVSNCTDAVGLMMGRTWRWPNFTIPDFNASSEEAGYAYQTTSFQHQANRS